MNSLKTPSLDSSTASAGTGLWLAFDFVLLALALEDHPGLIEHAVLDEDRHLGADGQGNRVARA